MCVSVSVYVCVCVYVCVDMCMKWRTSSSLFHPRHAELCSTLSTSLEDCWNKVPKVLSPEYERVHRCECVSEDVELLVTFSSYVFPPHQA